MGIEEFSYEHLFQYYSELFVKKLNEAIFKSQHTQTSLAKLLNRSPNAVFKWTKGLNIPNHVIEKILCDIFEIDQRYFAHEDMSFEEAKDLKRNGKDTIEILKKKVERLEKKLCAPPSKEEAKERIFRIIDAMSPTNADKILPLIETIYEDMT